MSRGKGDEAPAGTQLTIAPLRQAVSTVRGSGHLLRRVVLMTCRRRMPTSFSFESLRGTVVVMNP